MTTKSKNETKRKIIEPRYKGNIMKKIYLAGPDVFLKNHKEIGLAKKNLCKKSGFEGLYPMDNVIENANAENIFNANIELLKSSDIVLANLSPFRGISADVGTVVEVAIASTLGKVVYGYTNSTENYLERASSLKDGISIENFDITDNLMVTECIRNSGGKISAINQDELNALKAFIVSLSHIRSDQKEIP